VAGVAVDGAVAALVGAAAGVSDGVLALDGEAVGASV
jgi:hypothetical protein